MIGSLEGFRVFREAKKSNNWSPEQVHRHATPDWKAKPKELMRDSESTTYQQEIIPSRSYNIDS